jgi:polyisoprenoid-binding protein YceI
VLSFVLRPAHIAFQAGSEENIRMLDRIRTIVLIAVVLTMLAACGSTTSQTPTAAPAATSRPADAGAAAPAGARTFRIVPEQTEASYEVQEQFLNRNLPSMAVGKTNAVEGEFQFSANGQPTGQVTKITVDLRTLTSDDSRRDNRIRGRWLESEKYPFAEFTSTEAQNLPDSYSEGQDVSFKLTGNMTIREVTKPVTFDVTGRLQGDTVTGTATAQILMKDFGFDPPSVAGMLTVQDGVKITVNFTARDAAGS